MSCEILTNSKISDKDFLQVMIKHHIEAIDMSRLVLNTTENDNIQDYARRSIFNQENEIHLMERLSKNIPNLQGDKGLKTCNCGNKILTNNIDYGYPNIFSNVALSCNPDTFASLITPNSNYKLVDTNSTPTPTTTPYAAAIISTSTNEPTSTSMPTFAPTFAPTYMPTLIDTDYINHMVSHHKTGIELSKLVMRTTTEPKILNLAQTIVLEQEKEMFILINLNNCTKYDWRKIIKQ